MWLPNNIVADVDRTARIRYVDKHVTEMWNRNRGEGELRLLTGWAWVAKNGSAHQQGLKTMTAAYRDAWYALVAKRLTPDVTTAKPKLVKAA